MLKTAFGTGRFTRPPFGVVVIVGVAGESAGRSQQLELSLRHDDGYIATAIPLMACLFQLLDGSLKQPGVQMMGHAMEVTRFVEDMERLGMKVSETTG